ncbi:MAG: FAD-binding oxidoreductase [Colwellia sp.]|nr:FAD-binding oxidoreductase [Colwellia sp.]
MQDVNKKVEIGQDVDNKIVVIGAGIIGVTAALNLIREGYHVTLLDRDKPGESCSFGNAGLLAMSSFEPNVGISTLMSSPKWLLDPKGPLSIRWRYFHKLLPWLFSYVRACFSKKIASNAQALHGLTRSSLELYQQLVKTAGCESLVKKSDYLQVYRSKAEFDKAEAGMQSRRNEGYKVDVLEANTIKKLEPALSEQFSYGHQIHDHGYITDPGELLTCLHKQFLSEGGQFEQANVTDIKASHLHCQIICDGKSYHCSQMVLATGAFSKLLAKKIGEKVPLETERGYHETCHAPGVSISRPIMDGDRKFMATPMSMGLRFAGTVELAGVDAPKNPRRFKVLNRNAKEMISGLNTTDSSTWMGFRSTLPDSLPVICRSSAFPNIIYAFGHQHLGLTCAPKTAQLVTDLICGRIPSIDIAAFDIKRFK